MATNVTVYDVLVDDGADGQLIVTLTDEGVIFDLFVGDEDDEGFDRGTWAHTAQEIVDEFFI